MRPERAELHLQLPRAIFRQHRQSDVGRSHQRPCMTGYGNVKASLNGHR